MAWIHVVHEMAFLPMDSFLVVTSTFGRLGVQVFFVISGFVVPYALTTSGYRIRDYGRFLLKRIIRLDPPYVTALLLTLGIAALYTWLEGRTFDFTLQQILAHFGYVNGNLVHYPWINPVFWTLNVEAQYYVFVGLVFPLLLRRNPFWLVVAPLCIVLALSQLRQTLIFVHLPFFLMGIAAFHFRRGMLTEAQYLGVVFLLGAAVSMSDLSLSKVSPLLAGITGTLASMLIATVEAKLRPIAWLGTISYSLYLLHWPVGTEFANLVRGRVPPIIGVVLTLAACILAAWVMYRLVERPSLRWSKRIQYAGAKRSEIGQPTPGND